MSATRAALPAALRERLERLPPSPGPLARWRAGRRLLDRARFVVLDLETTGPRPDRDRLIAFGAVAVEAGALLHGDARSAVLRQAAPSAVDNILVHRIGAQAQLAGEDPAAALVSLLEFRGDAPWVAFRAEFDAAVLSRELDVTLGRRMTGPVLDLAQLLPALWPGLAHDSLDEWLGQFGIRPLMRHDASGDAYASAQLLLIVLSAAARAGARTVADLVAIERAPRWWGTRR